MRARAQEQLHFNLQPQRTLKYEFRVQQPGDSKAALACSNAGAVMTAATSAAAAGVQSSPGGGEGGGGGGGQEAERARPSRRQSATVLKMKEGQLDVGFQLLVEPARCGKGEAPLMIGTSGRFSNR